MTINNQYLLHEAVQHSQLILSYIAEKGIEIPKQEVQILTHSKYLDSGNKWTEEAESEFWLSYQKVTRLIRPASVDSLVATIERPISDPNFVQRILKRKFSPSPSHRAVKVYRTLTYTAVAILLLLQIYSVIGTTLLRKIEQNTVRMKDIEQKITDLSMINKSVNQRTSVQIGMLQSEFEELENEKNSSIALLKYWQNFEFIKITKEGSSAEKEEQQNFGPGQNPVYIDRVNIVQSANNTHIILNLYILPLLYGLLGALAFVLRNLPGEIKEMLFSKESNINYTLRITLGALLGLIVGLFWGDNSSVSRLFLANLPPLGVAFLAGYSVEFIFKLFDLIINTILKGNKKLDNANGEKKLNDKDS